MGKTSAMVEKHGADILWADPTVGGIVGVQRKFFTDLLDSLQDGRLQKEMAQLTRCRIAFLVVEGRPHWTMDGTLNHKFYERWTRDGFRSLTREIQLAGVTVEYTDDIPDTIQYIESLAGWLAKPTHNALTRRPKPPPDKWGQRSHRATQSHILQSFDAVGTGQADAILDHFGELPLAWTVSEKELLGVKGIGRKTVKAMTDALPVLVAPDVV